MPFGVTASTSTSRPIGLNDIFSSAHCFGGGRFRPCLRAYLRSVAKRAWLCDGMRFIGWYGDVCGALDVSHRVSGAYFFDHIGSNRLGVSMRLFTGYCLSAAID